MPTIQRKKIVVDATGRSPGRVATEIAHLLTGKHRVSYVPYHDYGVHVIVKNADQARLTAKKLEQKVFRHHTMHPGGLKEVPLKGIQRQDPTFFIRHAVAKMLPKNKFRSARLRRLKFAAVEKAK